MHAGSNTCHADCIFGCEALIGILVAGGSSDGHDVEVRLVDVDPDEVERGGDRLQLVVGELRCVLAGFVEVVSV